MDLLAVSALLFFDPGNSQPVKISIAPACEKDQQGACFLYVRTQGKWDKAHLASSVLIPFADL
jgi:hypothetical protein